MVVLLFVSFRFFCFLNYPRVFFGLASSLQIFAFFSACLPAKAGLGFQFLNLKKPFDLDHNSYLSYKMLEVVLIEFVFINLYFFINIIFTIKDSNLFFNQIIF